MINSAKHDPLHDIMSTVKDLIHPQKNVAPHLSDCRKHMLIGSGLTLFAAVLGGLAVGSMRKAKTCGQSHVTWKDQEKKLDEALDSTFDASDAVAKY
jgi:hypothetical protein